MLTELSLDGLWQASWFDGQRGCYQYRIDEPDADLSGYLDAQVPGEIHLDLMRAGIIPDPAVHANVMACRWVEECIWIYRRTFTVPDTALQGRSWLYFGELNYAAKIVLNGEALGTHANSFFPCRLETTGKLKTGENILTVHLDGGLFAVSEKPTEGYGLSLDAKLHKRLWLRKPQCEFSWDWAPRLINVGMGKSVRLEWTAAPLRLDQFVPLVKLNDRRDGGTVTARIFLEGVAAGDTVCELQVAMPELHISAKKTITVTPGLAAYEIEFAATGFDLWWPRGYGNPTLYEIELTVACDGVKIGKRCAAIGFRSVRFNQDPHPESGRYFTLEVNGINIFAKGANFVPADFIFARIDRERYRKLIELAEEVNFNLLRIWGGGLYESDDFYELCDRHGYLVWQEFCFSCTRYPAQDPDFLQSVIKEATFQARRLAVHPSLIAWCGSNEIQWHQTGIKSCASGVTLPDYGLFHLVLPRILAEEDPGRYYQPSSPYSPEPAQLPNRHDCGDQHPWDVGFHNNDFREYRKMACRFPCEGGILGPTSLPTMQACLPPRQQHRYSFAWMVHDNAIPAAAWVKPHEDTIAQLWLNKDFRSMTLEEYVYWGGLLQGEGLKEYCENFRRRMFGDSASAIFWMYNDCWPNVRSWTIVDYFLRRTPAFHFVRRAMNPIHVILAEEYGQCTVYGVNDTQEMFGGTLCYGMFSLDGQYLMKDKSQVEIPANSSIPLASFNAEKWQQRDSSMLFAMLSDAYGNIIARNRLCDKLFKEMKWPRAKVKVSVKNGRAIFQSESFVLDVCIDLDGETPLADNFFDLLPGMPYEIPWTQKMPPEIKFTGNL